jgi:hypothetical protein
MFCSLNFTPESISLTYQMLTPYFIVMLVAGVLFAAPIPTLYERIIRKRQAVALQGAAESGSSIAMSQDVIDNGSSQAAVTQTAADSSEDVQQAAGSDSKNSETQQAADSKDSQPAGIRQGAGWVEILSYTVSLVLLVWCMLRLSGSTYNPFIYFRF